MADNVEQKFIKACELYEWMNYGLTLQRADTATHLVAMFMKNGREQFSIRAPKSNLTNNERTPSQTTPEGTGQKAGDSSNQIPIPKI